MGLASLGPPVSADARPQLAGFLVLASLYPNGYTRHVYQIQRTEVFARWLAELRDAKGTARILARLDAVRLGSTLRERGGCWRNWSDNHGQAERV